MINHVSVKNFAIIKDSDVDFYPGLNIVTGETGAGKSVIIEAMSLALGSRADSSCIRTGEEKAVVEISGDVDGEEIILRREVSRNGRNIAKLNGEMVTLQALNEVSAKLADIHGQYDNQSLLNPDLHIVLLDSYKADETDEIKSDVVSKYEVYKNAKSRLITLLNNEKKGKRDLDFFKFEAEEIDNASLVPNEDTELEQKINVLKNSEKIYDGLMSVSSALSGEGSVVDVLSQSTSVMGGLSGYSDELKEMSESLNDVYYSADDLARSIKDMVSGMTFSQEELDDSIARLSLINSLKKKYSGEIEDILKYREELDLKIKAVVNFDSEKKELERALLDSRKSLLDSCSELTAVRTKVAEELSDKIENELKDLNFKDTSVKIEITPLDQPTENGIDKVEILISTNKGEPLKPLWKIASGGEISRIMLAFKNVISSYDKIPTLIFDEIDNGISGYTASVVAGKLRQIASNHQIICITHLPQIASSGDENFKIIKETHDDSTFSHISHLSENEKVEEIARLISGQAITEASIKSAEELIKESRL